MPQLLAALLFSSGVVAQASEAASPVMGRRSHNTGLRAVPAPGPVKIDGDLSVWDLSGRIWSFADLAIRDRFSTETAAMWNQDYLYLAAKFADPSPLHNTTDPKLNPRNGWMGDARQLRLRTDWPQWITFWYFSKDRKAAMRQDYWPTPTAAGEARMISTLRVGEPDSADIGDGVQLVIEDANGKRVRNLGAQLNAELYSVAIKDDKRTVEVHWDGLNDQGTSVAPGSYRVCGLSQPGLGVDYEMSFF